MNIKIDCNIKSSSKVIHCSSALFSIIESFINQFKIVCEPMLMLPRFAQLVVISFAYEKFTSSLENYQISTKCAIPSPILCYTSEFEWDTRSWSCHKFARNSACKLCMLRVVSKMVCFQIGNDITRKIHICEPNPYRT